MIGSCVGKQSMIRLGLAQTKPAIAKVEQNLKRTKQVLGEASREEIDVLVLPELANSGYVFESHTELEESSESIPDGLYCAALKAWSETGGLVVAGVCEVTSEGFYNSAIVFANGEYELTYRKIHLFNREIEWFLPGREEPPVILHKGHRFGVMVCFDWAFPEAARTLALKGAQVILHPSNLVLPYCQNAMITRSIENRVFTATANRIGEERGVAFSGTSQVTNPKGDILFRLSENSEELRWVDIEPTDADNKMITERNHVLGDRRPELYRRLT
ncbi:MAG: nitrilase-related carbon-nitrogen hydrolase [Candidatus Thorarchaeota archaeon]